MKFELNNASIVTAIIGTCAGVIGIGAAIYSGNKANKVAKKVGLTVEKLQDLTEVEVSDEIVNRAAEKAAKRAADEEVTRATKTIVNELTKYMEDNIKEQINEIYNDTKDSVTEEMKHQVSRISINGLKEEIKRETKRTMIDKLESSMDDILSDYNVNLNNIKNIYSSIAESITGKGNSGKNISLNL